jgi:hypothetical protein
MVRLVYLTLALAVAIGSSAGSAQTRGEASSRVLSMTAVVKAVSATSLTLERGGNELIFAVGSSTRVIGRGLSRDLLLRRPERRLADIVRAGDQVTVRYRQSGGAMAAVEVRVLRR